VGLAHSKREDLGRGVQLRKSSILQGARKGRKGRLGEGGTFFVSGAEEGGSFKNLENIHFSKKELGRSDGERRASLFQEKGEKRAAHPKATAILLSTHRETERK